MKNSRNSFARDMMSESMRGKWGLFVALGVALVALSIMAFANLALATQATIFYIGALMSIGGVAQIVHVFQVRSWPGFFYFLLSGLFYTAAGVIAYQSPIFAAATLTLVLSLSLILAGMLRLWSGFQLKPQNGWGWVLSSGLITTIAGLVLFAGWPITTQWLLGLVLAIDLMFQGVSAIALGLVMRIGRPSSLNLPRSPVAAY